MKLLAACNALFKPEYEQYPLVAFVYKTEYPVLFFSVLLQRLSTSNDIICHRAAGLLNDYPAVQSAITTTFLGERHTLWFGDISASDLSDKDKSAFLQTLKNYMGPHRIVVAIGQADVPKSFPSDRCITVDQDLTLEDKIKLVQFLYPLLSYELIKKITFEAGNLSLDQYVVLAQYATVVGKNTQTFVRDWINKIIIPESSLFLLAQYFFSRKKADFWKLWNSVKQEYPATFWTVFWSEQLWRAHYVVAMQQQNNVLEARSMAYRLPFSFLQKDSKTLSLTELAVAHAQIYEIEWRIKNGGSEDHFEFLFHKFMNRKLA